MPVPDRLVENYHTVTAGGKTLLSTDGHDFFPHGQEPTLQHVQAVDAPDCPGLQQGPLFLRGNVRWTASITRVREFLTFTYPVTDGSVTAANPEEYAQKWLVRHLDDLAGITAGGLSWNGTVCTTASVNPDGTTDCGYAMITYQIQASNG
ncbi:MAG: hypothetical protein JWM59_1539 [Verrucomicrobiales bacterium]|nr:hypothetical protein [Verrucomicrobiales bacterium]